MEHDAEHSSFTRADIARRFGALLEGDLAALFLVVSDGALSPAARQALDKAAGALDWTEGASFVNLGVPGTLSKAELFEIVEGLDPVCVVVAGQTAAALAEQAYQTSVPPQGRFRLFGREACSFADLDSLLNDNGGKQKAWALLKTLPKSAGF